MKRIFKNKLFLFGFSVISVILSISILYFLFFQDRIPTVGLLYDNTGKPIQPPYSGKVYPPLGTDNFGRNIAVVMIVGAKYTIFAAIVISLIRIIPSIIFGFIIHYYLQKIKNPIKYLADAINYFPITLFAFLILNWVSFQGIIMMETTSSYWELVMLYILVVSVVFIPMNSILIANEVELINKMEFIECSRTLGATSRRIITKHIKPFLVPKLYIIFIREFIQSLILMAHLGVLSVFIGGIVLKGDLFGNTKPISPTSEWAGTLGMWWSFLWTSYPWISLVPIILLTILILAAKCVLNGLQDVLSLEEHVVSESDGERVDQFESLESFQLIREKSI